MPSGPRRAAIFAGTAAVLLAGSLALFWPGVAMYDSVGQFQQVLSGEYEDWHPPAMARVWAGLHAAFGGGAEPMLAMQMALYWAGFGLIGGALARRGSTWAAGAVLAVASSPLFLGWQAVVLKDTQMLGAMLAACGVLAWWRLCDAPPPPWAVAGAVGLIGYATLVRANAVFATVPLLAMLFGPRNRWRQAGLGIVGIGAVLALLPTINDGMLGAVPTGVQRTEAAYDLAGIAVRMPDAAIGLTRAETRTIAARHCVKPLFWDPLGDPTRCGPVLARLRALPVATLYQMLAAAIVRHPVAYAAHRLAHLNSTWRWLVPYGWPAAAPPAVSEPNRLGLASPGGAARGWQAAARWMAETPLGWPVAWLALAVVAFGVAAGRGAGASRDLALALLGSALALEASFAVLSIASDLRYHLWPMVATALAAVLLRADAPWPRRAVVCGGLALALVVVTGTAARLTLPAPPKSYRALLL